MAKTLPVSTTTNIFLPVRNTLVKAVALCAAAADSVLEVFDGTIDAIATFVIGEGGSSYSVGDLITLVVGEFGGTQAILRVTQIDDHSPSSSISASPSLSVSSSPSLSSSPSASASPSSSVSLSPSASESPSTSISSSPSASESPSTSISASPSTSISSSVSLSPSSSISLSVSSSISSSPSASLSPSVGAGRVTAAEVINAGGGYTAGNTYATTTDGDGTGATITVSTVTDVGTSIAKLACVATESASPIVFNEGILTTKGVSVRISGASAKGHLTYE